MQKKLLNNFEEIIASLFICCTLVLVVANIFLRYFVKTGIPWSEEAATACFVWAVYIGASAAYKQGQHIGIDLIVKHFSNNMRNVVQLIVHLILFVVIVFICSLSILYIKTTYIKVTPVLAVSSAYISCSIAVSFVFMAIRTIILIIKDIKMIRDLKGAQRNE